MKKHLRSNSMEGDAFHDEQQYQEALDEWDFVEAQGGKQLATLQSGDSYSRQGSTIKLMRFST